MRIVIPMRIFLVLLSTILLFSIVSADFRRSFLSMEIDIKGDGSASVKEELRFRMEGSYSIDIYKISLKSANDLGGWRRRLNLSDVRYHINTVAAPITNARLHASDPETCNYEGTLCYGTFTLEYDIEAPKEDKGIVKLDRYKKPRVVSYNLMKEALSFEFHGGELFLPEYTTLVIRIPGNAQNISVEPKPVEYPGRIPIGSTTFTLQGSLPLSNMKLYFERKESLLQEVTGFFDEVQTTLAGWISSREGTALSVAIVIIIVSYLILQKKKS